MGIEYDSTKLNEENAYRIYHDLVNLPEGIRISLQELIYRSPIVEIGRLIEDKRRHKHRVTDIGDILDNDD